MQIMAWGFPILLVLIAVFFIVIRGKLARIQSLFAGGNISPGCIVAEAAVILLLALLVVLARKMGISGP